MAAFSLAVPWRPLAKGVRFSFRGGQRHVHDKDNIRESNSMGSSRIKQFSVKKYRSLMDIKIAIDEAHPVVICGENNIGKTNFLRAMNLFFNHIHQEDLFDPERDIPNHIYYGSRGSGARTELSARIQEDDQVSDVLVIFDSDGTITYSINGNASSDEEAREILGKFQFIFIESHNVNLPVLISEILERDGLLRLDAKRAKQKQPMAVLEKFIELSQKAIADIEKGINECFAELTDFDGVLKGKRISIRFAEFERLRDAVKNMTSITLFDGNSHGVASKGGGAQRAIFISLMQYIAKHSKRNVVWGIDEPEAFLQPRLQKKVASTFEGIAFDQKQSVIITTHSQHFINLSRLDSTHLFKGDSSPKQYKRRPGRTYFEIDTKPVACSSAFEKAVMIKKHLGISNNDGWELLPFNILVEGEEDKKYLQTLFDLQDIPSHNIVWSGGASKIGAYLQYYNAIARDLPYKPRIICVFDNDDEGREQSKKVKPLSYGYLDVSLLDLIRYDGARRKDFPGADWEIEDFLPPSVVVEAVNQILREDGYKPIKKDQVRARGLAAHKNKQILAYLEECARHVNHDREPISLDNEGRKKQVCMYACSNISKGKSEIVLSDAQIAFLRELSL